MPQPLLGLQVCLGYTLGRTADHTHALSNASAILPPDTHAGSFRICDAVAFTSSAAYPAGILGFIGPLLAFECAIVGVLGCAVETCGTESGGALESVYSLAQGVGKVAADLLVVPLFRLLPGGVAGPAGVTCAILVITWAATARNLDGGLPVTVPTVPTLSATQSATQSAMQAL